MEFKTIMIKQAIPTAMTRQMPSHSESLARIFSGIASKAINKMSDMDIPEKLKCTLIIEAGSYNELDDNLEHDYSGPGR